MAEATPEIGMVWSQIFPGPVRTVLKNPSPPSSFCFLSIPSCLPALFGLPTSVWIGPEFLLTPSFLFSLFFYHKLNLIFQQLFIFISHLEKNPILEYQCAERKQCRAIVGQVCIGLLIPKLAECKSSTLDPVSIHRSLLASSTPSLF